MTVVQHERREPWLKFFHADWQSDESVQMCSLAARGLWFELILFMHKSESYGHLFINGRPPTMDELIRAVRPKSRREFLDAMAELEQHHVYSKTTEGVIFCRRMVRRRARVEASRENGSLGGRPTKPNSNLDGNLDPNLTRNLEKTPRSQKLEARSQKQKRGGSPRPIFTGQRFVVFEWFLEKAERVLGQYFEDFDIHSWFYDVDTAAVKSAQVIPDHDSGRWLIAQLTTEAKRRGLPIAGEKSPDDPYANLTSAWECRECGQVHEGTREQARAKRCLGKAS